MEKKENVRFDLVYPISLIFTKEEFEDKIGYSWKELIEETVNLDILDKVKEYAGLTTNLESTGFKLEFAEVTTKDGKEVELTELEE